MTEIIIKKTDNNVQIKKSYIVNDRIAELIEKQIMDLAEQERRHTNFKGEQ